MSFSHRSVLLEEVVALFRPSPDKTFVDATLGAGGHSEALLAAGASVVGFDRDPRALEAATARLARFGSKFRPVHATFAQVEAHLHERVDGVLADIGVSSPQFDDPSRGFSFRFDAPLDMRMAAEGETAAALIARLSAEELEQVIHTYGEERFAGRVARELKVRLPQTTFEAVRAVESAIPRKAWPRDIHVATRTFQALRIAVNAELEELDALLGAVPRLLRPGGIAAIISFHSLEDRLVKRAFKALCGEDDAPPSPRLPKGLPLLTKPPAPTFRALTRKPLVAGDAEIEANPRARSAKLRAVVKVSP